MPEQINPIEAGAAFFAAANDWPEDFARCYMGFYAQTREISHRAYSPWFWLKGALFATTFEFSMVGTPHFSSQRSLEWLVLDKNIP